MQIPMGLPDSNRQIFEMLYCIESALRELLVEELANHFGPTWYKKCLPGEILSKYREGLSAERKVKWSTLTPHHPIYYTDSAHLKIVIQSKNNWDAVFSAIFG